MLHQDFELQHHELIDHTLFVKKLSILLLLASFFQLINQLQMLQNVVQLLQRQSIYLEIFY
mgnify:CR=1 FL=1